jgi:hypothetical protein
MQRLKVLTQDRGRDAHYWAPLPPSWTHTGHRLCIAASETLWFPSVQRSKRGFGESTYPDVQMAYTIARA